MSVTREQPLEALERANYVRLHRAELKRQVKRGEVTVSSVLSGEIPDWLERMAVYELIDAIPQIRKRTIARILAEVGNLSFSRNVGMLTVRQRNLLVAYVEAFENRAKKRARTKFERGVR